jgi:hypothetical protein
MIRQQWKDLAEAVGFIAIIASLVFVGIESRNSTKQSMLNTQALEIAAYQALMSNIDGINSLSLESQSAADILAKAYGVGESATEQFQINRALYILFRHGDLAFFMYERGAIDEDRLRSALAPIPINSEAGREFWERRREVFTKNYREYVDRWIANSDADSETE